jgi:hypothetical protein
MGLFALLAVIGPTSLADAAGTNAGSAAGTAGGTPADAESWANDLAPTVSVNKHAFHDVTARAQGCNIRFGLFFTAPEDQYNDPRNKVRNTHNFQARVRLGDHRIDSPRFVNRAGGERWFSWTFDSSAQGCWAKDAQKLWKLDVVGCRGERCPLESLQ